MENLDVITIGEAMAMFVATETGDLAEVEHFMKRVAGAELNVATGLARLGLKVGWGAASATTALAASYCNRWRKRGSIATLWPSTTASLPVSR
ncbi:PfkB family carbohydrate kinase [Klebsiella pneumoniae]|nr:PfkB family carbohydrate kinase [Klebsiella pneumoniae]